MDDIYWAIIGGWCGAVFVGSKKDGVKRLVLTYLVEAPLRFMHLAAGSPLFRFTIRDGMHLTLDTIYSLILLQSSSVVSPRRY